MRCKDDIKTISAKQEKLALINEQYSQEEETDQCLIQGESNGKQLPRILLTTSARNTKRLDGLHHQG